MSRHSRDAIVGGADAELVEQLRGGDEIAFTALVRAQHSVLLGVAMTYVSSRAVAEEVVQETWLGVLAGLDGFEGRSSLRTWIFRIAANVARTRAARDGRSRPFSSMAAGNGDSAGPTVDPERFLPADHPVWPGHWARRPTQWDAPEARLLSRETRDLLRAAIALLPPGQRLVVALRDVEGWSAEETCEALDLTATNQRVLLHRARSTLCKALERHLAASDAAV
jgi:RNA polymerase sigma-70 factor (ECF subfamily)